MVIKDMKFIDLFAGIGGFRYALESFGCKCVFSSEWDKFCQESYNLNFGDIPYGDITKIDEVEVEKFGENDSTTPDIEIRLNKNGKSFFVETKMPNSQTSQFAVEITNDRFIYGRKNCFPSNNFSDEILEELNENFNYLEP